MSDGYLLEDQVDHSVVADVSEETPFKHIRGQILLPGGIVIPKDHTDGPHPVDLTALIKALENHHKQETDAYPSAGDNEGWELKLVQGFLVTLLIMVSISWACCCKKRCLNAAPATVQQALRKLSVSSNKSKNDLPPSYSNVDLHTLAMSVQDYLYPPPNYIDIARSAESLSYLDLEAGHQRMSRLSFCSTQSAADLLALSAAVSRKSSFSAANQNVETAILAPIVAAVAASRRNSMVINGEAARDNFIKHKTDKVPPLPKAMSRSTSSSSMSSSGSGRSLTSSLSASSFPSDSSIQLRGHRRSGSVVSPPPSSTGSRKTSIIKDQTSRKSSGGSEEQNRRSSRVSFSEEVECSNGTFSKLNSPVELSRKASSESRKSSGSSINSYSSNDASRRSSSSIISRKLGLSQDALDKELRKRLERLAAEEAEAEAQEAIKAQSKDCEDDRQKLETVVEIEKY